MSGPRGPGRPPHATPHGSRAPRREESPAPRPDEDHGPHPDESRPPSPYGSRGAHHGEDQGSQPCQDHGPHPHEDHGPYPYENGGPRPSGDHSPHPYEEAPEAAPRVLPALASALARELVRRVDEERQAVCEARRDPTRSAGLRVDECRRNNTEALRAIVRRHAWPTADLVGAPASTAALMILLHARDLDFQLACRDLIARAVADGRCPAPHHAYIADHCAVEQGQPQFYGTRIDPATFRPYPVRLPRTLDERRRDMGLAPLDEQMRTLRHVG
ncbi:DUF6624 domain-containing protein [Streptomyces fructofermentans]|uniref:DUF6624 domain-containing protein n=1 Tax=Streptomyces fructofermentans TaxID=152141 RepID=UPI003400F099